MLNRRYDPTLPYRYLRYGRMSDPKQNKRSPDQQFATIEEERGRCAYPWQHVTTYRDDGISGRYLRKRPGYQQMLRDIETGMVQVDLIVVDTYERLGRAEEVAFLRHRLLTEYGVMVVAADNHFADPTGVVGKAVGMVESIRSTEDGRIKAHNVVRGKKDAARLKRWPGGTPPFGFKLKPVVDQAGSEPDVYSILEEVPRELNAMRMAFQRAAETGHGSPRLTKWWNRSPDIPNDFKPVSPFTMGYRLSNPIYIGTLRWNAHSTAVVCDSHVKEANPESEVLYIKGFCPASIDIEVYQQVQKLRAMRRSQIEESRAKNETEPAKLITPEARGLALKYPLAGLVRCQRCKASMRPVASGRQSKSGMRYVYYVCPRHYDGACPNSFHIREDQLREAVLGRIRVRLFPPPEQAGDAPAWLPELMSLVQQELQRYRACEPDRAAADQEELHDLERQLAGWTMTLGDPALPALVRSDIGVRYEKAKLRHLQVTQAQAEQQALEKHVTSTLSPQTVIEQLHKLDDVLGGYNPTLVNLELSKHIDRIECFPDGRVELRGTRLGLLEGGVALLNRDTQALAAVETCGDLCQVKPRRRGRLRVPNLSADSQAKLGDLDTALNPERFAGLPEAFFWTESFVVEGKKSWAEQHAAEVVRLRATMTMAQLAAHFDKTVPTIRDALRKAAAAGLPVADLPKKLPRPRWAQDHASEVLRLQQQGMTTLELARHFSKSDTTIRTALAHARVIAEAQPADETASNATFGSHAPEC